MRPVFSFQWSVCKRGHHWWHDSPRKGGDPEDPSEWRLQFAATEEEYETFNEDNPDHFRLYDPFKDSSLYKNFADTEPTKDGILKFANQFGLLGIADDSHGESFNGWQHAIEMIQSAVLLWEAIAAADDVQIRAHVDTAAEGQIRFVSPLLNVLDEDLDEFVFELEESLAPLPRGRKNARLHAAKHLLRWAIELRFRDGIVWGKLDEENGRLRLKFRPRSLEAAIWLQLALAINELKNHRQCAACNRWFEVSPEVNRSDRMFCSGPCRNRAYRKRQSEAVQLSEQGKTPRQIAELLDSEPETVKGWIENKKGTTNAKKKTRARRGRNLPTK